MISPELALPGGPGELLGLDSLNRQSESAVSICLAVLADLMAVFYEWVVGRAGFEPATNGLKVRCSTS